MIAVLLLGLLACASAAPRFHHRQEQNYGALSDYVFDDNHFDTNRFWTGLDTTSLIEQILQDFEKHFPSTVNTEGFEGNNYKIIISLPDYEEKDIIVKAREGMLLIEATRTAAGDGIHSYLNYRTLPTGIDTAGSWNHNDGILTITFPRKEATTTESSEEVVTPELTTEAPRDREPMEPYDKDGNENADVNIDHGLETNEIFKQSPVEATTYAVDVNNDIEFVTVSLK